MNNSNPFVPQGSLLEQQSKRRSRMKLGVFCVLGVSVVGLMAVLIQGCKREQAPDTTDNGMPPAPTNDMTVTDTNLPPFETSNTVSAAPSNAPVYVPPVVVAPAPVEPAGTEYVVVAHDTLGKIAKKNGVSLKALQAANPGVIPTRLKVGQKLTIPASGSAAASMAGAATASASADTGTEIYMVKSGDTLSKIARTHGTTVKALQAENNLTTTRITVGKKLKIPAKAEAVVPAPAVETAPVAPAPATSPAPAPAQQ
jgi:LysM repeat protein